MCNKHSLIGVFKRKTARFLHELTLIKQFKQFASEFWRSNYTRGAKFSTRGWAHQERSRFTQGAKNDSSSVASHTACVRIAIMKEARARNTHTYIPSGGIFGKKPWANPAFAPSVYIAIYARGTCWFRMLIAYVHAYTHTDTWPFYVSTGINNFLARVLTHCARLVPMTATRAPRSHPFIPLASRLYLFHCKRATAHDPARLIIQRTRAKCTYYTRDKYFLCIYI